jgi:MFS family permease
VVVVLLAAYILAFVDREIIAQLVPGIKATLHISDTQMSLLLGAAFAIFYTFFGVLIASFADSSNRRNLLFFGIVFWSLMTMMCGVAMTFPLLFIARVGVGAGEATLNPCALSMLKDYFPPDRLGRAIGLYTAGVSSGSGIAFIIGGTFYPAIQAAGPAHWPIVGTVEPWQQMFIYVGAPGLLIALLLLTVREPVRRELADATQKSSRVRSRKRSRIFCIAGGRSSFCSSRWRASRSWLTASAFGFRNFCVVPMRSIRSNSAIG